MGHSVGGDVGHMEMGGTAVTPTPHPTAWNCQLCPLHPKARSSHWGAAGGAGMGMGTSNVERQRVTGNGGKQNGRCGGMGGRRGCGGTGDPGKDDRGHIGEGGNQGKRGCGAVGTRRYGDVGTGRYGDMGMWGHGDMRMWGCGDVGMWGPPGSSSRCRGSTAVSPHPRPLGSQPGLFIGLEGGGAVPASRPHWQPHRVTPPGLCPLSQGQSGGGMGEYGNDGNVWPWGQCGTGGRWGLGDPPPNPRPHNGGFVAAPTPPEPQWGVCVQPHNLWGPECGCGHGGGGGAKETGSRPSPIPAPPSPRSPITPLCPIPPHL